MTLFEGRDLACVRGERGVFAGLSFTVPRAGALTLSGPNGSGKSSLLRLMAGLLKPALGELTWDGEPVLDDQDAHRARLHYVGHLDAVKTDLTAAENLSFWAATSEGGGMGVEAALDRVGLARLSDVAARLLSAGQRRRLALARLLAGTAELWLLDEPTVGLDDESVKRLQTVLAEHREGGGRVVVATHTALDLPGAERLDLAAFPAAATDLEAW